MLAVCGKQYGIADGVVRINKGSQIINDLVQIF